MPPTLVGWSLNHWTTREVLFLLFDQVILLFYIYINLFIFGCVGSSLLWEGWAFSSCSEQGLLFIAARGLLIAVASLVAEHGL